MPELSTIMAGLGDAVTPINLLFVLFGVMIGQFVGAVPGIGRLWRWRLPFPLPLAWMR